MGINDVPKTELIERAAKELQGVNSVQPPSWSLFVKTGTFKERPPTRADWWFVRAAAILRRLADSNGPIGVQKLRTLYGGRKNRGHAPERFFKGSGNIIRKILQQLEKAGFAKKVNKGLHKGRVITPAGLSFLSKIASQIMKEKNIVLPRKPDTELTITELPKEKPVKKPRVRKKAVEKPAQQVTVEPGAEAVQQAVAEKPKRKRAPKKTPAVVEAQSPAQPVETSAAQTAPAAEKTS